MGSLEQTELPAWLESLRTSERPGGAASGGASAGGPPGFTAADFFDEGTLPSWMRADNTDMADQGTSGKYPAWRPAALPAPNTDGEAMPPRGFAASSLIDESALPSWMQGKQPDAAEPPAPPRNIAASSLVQPDAIPDWLRNMPQSQQPAGAPPLATGRDNAPGSQVGMNNLPPPPQPISAHELIDQQALPSWMAAQPNQASQPGQQVRAPYSPPGPSAGNGQGGIGASSLLDMNALPSWLRENEQGRSDQGPMRPQNLPAQSQPMPNGSAGNNGSGTLAGASLIDLNALPGWLRAAEGGQGQQYNGMPAMGPGAQAPHSPEFMGNPRQAQPPFVAPPRVDNMRVPSRPRGEMGTHEQSEVAANVFSSMLGVASSAPYYPAQPAAGGGAFVSQQGLPGEQFQQQQVQGQMGMGMGMGQAQVMPPSPSGALPQMGNAAPGRQPVPGGYPGEYATGNRPGAVGQQPPANPAGMQPGPAGTGQRSNATMPGSKPARRSIIDTIREWFSR